VSVGDKVQHLKFGNGQVIGLEGNNDNVKAKIKFEKIGDKNLLLKFAKLKVL
jgi:DNA helicase-2/ATP-dependent DNA helicase PcrA